VRCAFCTNYKPLYADSELRSCTILRAQYSSYSTSPSRFMLPAFVLLYRFHVPAVWPNMEPSVIIASVIQFHSSCYTLTVILFYIYIRNCNFPACACQTSPHFSDISSRFSGQFYFFIGIRHWSTVRPDADIAVVTFKWNEIKPLPRQRQLWRSFWWNSPRFAGYVSLAKQITSHLF
jgi:hypothetical protein